MFMFKYIFIICNKENKNCIENLIKLDENTLCYETLVIIISKR